MKRFLCCLAAVLLIAVSLVPAEAQGAAATGRGLTELFFRGASAELWGMFSPELQAAFGTEDGFRQFQAQVVSAFGSGAELVHEEVSLLGEWWVYQGLLQFPGVEVYLAIQWAFDDREVIGGLYVTQVPKEAPSQFLDYETKTELYLPFTGEWYVYWGGRSIGQNYHAADAAQRFALDFLVLENGSSHAGAGTANEDYYAFGRPILAPAAGLVIAAVDGIGDNIPGSMNPEQPLGNHVVIDHQNGEYSFLAHLQRGSVAVQVGDWVEPGDLLGLCGNSGNSSEPHLHNHLQNTPDFPGGEGLPALFRSYLVDGVLVERGEPLRGQFVAPAEK
ncbi:MAG: M23 family metallopeptidase [Limnochordia bacterium]|jgi:murein DD-endopeptidase MepM/ murein hydrolase activator NlpD|nr:M23 family metallopeptidase [Limnochordia bacterium]MDI9465598.1 M23 family metallopeptidase [Bacillota bacterium]NLO95371.1 M23 family metallopeptidase [Bacillota bacterium]HOB39525.1 M23 family metallopeptidase [Limnochordia bacterium]HOK30569.1 M23 family metallopeptidase [Limnochordia bacterium]